MGRVIPSGTLINRLRRNGLLLISCCLAIGGCARHGEDSLYDVSGTVSLDGEPLTRGFVQFVPVGANETNRPRLTGMMDENGAFTLVGPGGQAGAPAGVYVITVHEPHQELRGSDPNGQLQTNSTIASGPALPLHYSDESTSGLTFEVGPSQEKFELRLTTNSLPMQMSRIQ